MKLGNIFIVIAVILLVFFSVQVTTILNNNHSMKNINIALRSNIDAVLIEANIRGTSAHFQSDLAGNQTIFHIQELYASYERAVTTFSKIVSGIESGESKRPQTEISEELAAHKKTLSDSTILLAAIKDYLSGEAGMPADDLFDAVFESSTVSLELDSKHSNELKEEDNQLLRSVNSITFLMVGLEILIVIATLFVVFFKIITPIQKLTKTIESISLGKIDVDIEGKGRKDEIGDLARAFERTIVSLKLAMRKSGKIKLPEEKEENQAEKLKSAFKV